MCMRAALRRPPVNSAHSSNIICTSSSSSMSTQTEGSDGSLYLSTGARCGAPPASPPLRPAPLSAEAPEVRVTRAKVSRSVDRSQPTGTVTSRVSPPE
ncbi:hypothetical protein F751_5364 [Auxenochlorella protothecoides]|uniref:Uncharacterized protein n=1 Tax=Auxenochlorella protothecoides TaxID=3075 RepID=A0A087SRU7_AUXPR|nr:hypothetical protein F751_5364 [Auxenochlorella protothecoides]KFM28451.1 hypothetical protein F751_5364 [Auxenochlorella protothecoides]